MSGKLIKDAINDSSVVNKNFKLPVDNKSKLSPHNKGNFLYNVVDNVLYYSDGMRWIPLISGLGNNLIAGPGISIVANGNNITISNTSPATSVTLSSLGGTFPLVPFPETGPALGIMGLNAGTGIFLTTDGATEVTINNSATLTSLDPGGAGNLVPGSPQSGSYSIRGIAPTNPSIAITNNLTDVLIARGNLTETVLSTFGGTLISPFTVPANAVSAYLVAVGGGGGGAGGDSTGEGGGGGAGGNVLFNFPLVPGEVLSFGVGIGGIGGAAGVAGGGGGLTFVSTTVSLGGASYAIFGGNGGSAPSIGLGGAGGSATAQSGMALYFGGSGGQGGGLSPGAAVSGTRFATAAGGAGGSTSGGNFGGGGGGATYFSIGGVGGAGMTGSTGGLGGTPITPGGGGGGGGGSNIAGGQGGAGEAGMVQVVILS
jgi:hypothetical protein